MSRIWREGRESSHIGLAEDADFIVQRGCEVFADQCSAFAVPRGSPEELIRYHLAAHKAYFFGYKSIDYVMKAYAGRSNTPPDYPESYRLIHDATSKIRHNVEVVGQRGGPILSSLPDRFGLIAAWAALVRLQSSFRAACVLCETVMGFEVFCLAKLILEQIAWAYAVHQIEDDSLYKVKPWDCINRLKRLYPHAGRAYGLMNEQAHIDPKKIHDYTRVDGEDFRIVLRDTDKCLHGCLHLLQLADMYGACTEVIYRRWLTTFHFIVKKGSEPRLKPRRKSLAEIKMYKAAWLRYADRRKSPP